jgi:cobalamin biosynthesis protein CbiD
MLYSIRENEGNNAATTATSTPTIEFTYTTTTTTTTAAAAAANSIVSTATILVELDMPPPITDYRIEMSNIVVVIDTLPFYITT